MKHETISELAPKIIGWAKEKDLIKAENASKQYLKFLEEVGETARFIILEDVDDETLKNKGFTKDEVKEKIKDGFGDIAITVIILAAQLEEELDIDLNFVYQTSSEKEFDYFLDHITPSYVSTDSLSYIFMSAKWYRYDLVECINIAWDQIKDRTGKSINGSFVKD